jgi:hypothetical protein
MTSNLPISPSQQFPVITGNLQPPVLVTGLANDKNYTVTIIAHLLDGTTITETKSVYTHSSPPPVPPVPGISNNTGMSGTGVPGSKIRIYDENGNLRAEVTVDLTGHWNIPADMFPGGTSDGFTGSISVVDPNGNESDQSPITPIDGTAPAVPILLTNNAIGISGTAEPGSTITLRNSSGVPKATVTVDTNGNWSIPAASFPGETTSGFVGSITATDQAGNESLPLAIGPIDATPPTIPFTTSTNDSGISGYAEPGATITLYNADGTVQAVITADGTGYWELPASVFPNGTPNGFNGYITATDPSGNVSANLPLINISTSVPNPPVITVANGIKLAGTAEPNSTIKLIDALGNERATVLTNSSGNWEIPAALFPNQTTNGFSGTCTASNANGTSTATVVLPIAGVAPAAPVIVTANSAGLTGTSVSGYTIKLLNSTGVEVASATVLNDGTWSISPSSSFQVNGFIGTCYAMDTIGNISPSVSIPEIDITPPAAPIIKTANSYGISGTAEPGSRISLKDGTGDEAAYTFADLNGNWTIPSNSFPGLATDGFSGTVTATDSAGNESIAVTVNAIDGTLPTTPSLTSYLDNVGSIASSNSIAATTDDTTPGLNIGVDLSDIPKLYIDMVLVDSIYTRNTGVLTPKDELLIDGTYSFTYTLTDSVGNESLHSPALTIIIDTTAPIASLTTYKDDIGSITNNNSIAVTTDDTRPGMNVGTGLTHTFELYINNAKVLADYSSVLGTLTPIAALDTDGTYSFSYKATDAAGNKSLMSPVITIIVDRVAPVTPAVAPPSYDDNVGAIVNTASVALVTDDSTPGINIGTGITTTVRLYVNNILTAATYDPVTGKLTPDSGLSDGLKSITYTLTDDAGNESGKSPAISVTIDTALPTVALTSYTDDVGNIINTVSTVSVTDDKKPGLNIGYDLVETTTLYIDNISTAATYNPNAGTLTPIAALNDGTYSFCYTLTDAAGNTSLPSPTLTITIDTVAPTNPASAPASYKDDIGSITSNTSIAPTTDDKNPEINIGIGITDKVTLYINHLFVVSTYDPITGICTPLDDLDDGTYDFTYTLSDVAGNETAQSPAIVITVDTISPLTPAVGPVNYADDVLEITNSMSYAPVTNDNKPGINIGFGILFTPNLYVDGTKVTSTYDSVAGTLTPVSAISDGLKSITYTLTDPAGNESGQSPALVFTIDTVAPSTTTPTQYKDDIGSITSDTNTSIKTDDTKPGIVIGAGIVDTIKLYIDGVFRYSTYDSVAGTLTTDDTLLDGSHNFSYTLTDAAGNESSLSPAFTITVDTVSPIISTVTLSWGAKLEYAESFSDASITVATTGMENNQTIAVIMNGTTYTGTVTSNSGTITIPASALTGLTNKANASLTTTATDLAGNVSSSVTSTFYVDYTPSGWVSSNVGNSGQTWVGTAVNSVGDIFAVGYGSSIVVNGSGALVSIGGGGSDIRVAKFNKHGILQWQTQVGNTVVGQTNVPGEYINDFAYSMTIDSSDNVYFTGTTEQYDSVAPGYYTNTLIGSVNSTGNFRWAKMLGNKTTRAINASDDIGYAIASDSSGNVYMTGVCSDNYAISNIDMIIVKYDSAGSQIWKHTLGYVLGTDKLWTDRGFSISVSGTSVFVVGSTNYGSAILKYNTSGTLQWQKHLYNSYINAVTSDASGNAYITGYSGNNGFVIGKYSAAGVLSWQKTNTGVLNLGNYPKIACYGTNLYVITKSGPQFTAVMNWDVSGRFIWCNVISAKGNSPASYSITVDDKFIYLTDNSIPISRIIKLRVDGSQPGSYSKIYPTLYQPMNPLDPLLYDELSYLDYSDSVLESNSSMDEYASNLTQLTYTVPTTNVTMAYSNLTLLMGGMTIAYYLVGDERPPAITTYSDNVMAITNNYSTAPVTNDPVPSLNIGTGLANPKLYVNGTLMDSVYDINTGTLTPLNPLTTDGRYTFKYTIDDTYGITSLKSMGYSIILDTVTPTTPISAPTTYADNVGYITSTTSIASSTDDTTPGINIPTGLTDIPTLYVDDVLVESTYDRINGVLTPDSGLTDGTHTFKYSLMDAAGNESDKSPEFSITIDTTAPTTPTIAPYSYKNENGDFSVASLTKDVLGLRVNNYSGISWYRVYATATGQTEKAFTTTYAVDQSDSSKVILTFNTPSNTSGMASVSWTFKYTLLDAVGNESGKSPGLTVEIDAYAEITAVSSNFYATDGLSITTLKVADVVAATAKTVTLTTAGAEGGYGYLFIKESSMDNGFLSPIRYGRKTITNNVATFTIPNNDFLVMRRIATNYHPEGYIEDTHTNYDYDNPYWFDLDFKPVITGITYSWGNTLTTTAKNSSGTITVQYTNALDGSYSFLRLAGGSHSLDLFAPVTNNTASFAVTSAQLKEFPAGTCGSSVWIDNRMYDSSDSFTGGVFTCEPNAFLPFTIPKVTAIRLDTEVIVTFPPVLENQGYAPVVYYDVISTPGAITVNAQFGFAAFTNVLTVGTSYTFKVIAYCGDGTYVTSATSNAVTPIATGSGTNSGNPPSAPRNVTATATAPGKIRVVWDYPSSDGGTGTPVIYYHITSNHGDVGDGLSNYYDLTGLTAGLSYTFTVTAANSNGYGTAATSNTVTVTAELTAPGQITSFAAMPGTATGTIDIVFNPPAYTGGSPITKYIVYASALYPIAVGTSSPVTITGLLNEVPYYYSISAQNSYGNTFGGTNSNYAFPRVTMGNGNLTSGYYIGNKTAGEKMYIIPKSWEQPAQIWGNKVSAGEGNSSDDGSSNTRSFPDTGELWWSMYHQPELASSISGYSQFWFWPAINELVTAYANKASLPADQAFDSTYYWSSTEVDLNTAKVIDMSNGTVSIRDKSFKAKGRAMRRGAVITSVIASWGAVLTAAEKLYDGSVSVTKDTDYRGYDGGITVIINNTKYDAGSGTATIPFADLANLTVGPTYKITVIYGDAIHDTTTFTVSA